MWRCLARPCVPSPAAAHSTPADAHPRHLPIRVHLEIKQNGQVAEALGPLLVGALQNMLTSSTAEGPSK